MISSKIGKFAETMWEAAKARLLEGWTFEQFCGRERGGPRLRLQRKARDRNAKKYRDAGRGKIKNRNGIVRKVLSKGSDFNNITPEQMARIDHMLNDRPMKCLGWRTPREAFMARLAYYLKAARSRIAL